MQKVAERLGVTKMALYRYVSSKDELIAIAVERAVGDPPTTPTTDGDWRARTHRWAGELRQVWQAHPWLPGATLGARMIGPREIGWSEAAARALEGSGLQGAALRTTISLLFAHSRSALALDVAGTQYWNVGAEPGAELRERLRAEAHRFPLISAAGTGDADHDPWLIGLELILDGIAARRPD
jgi:AcrR family transcriptional regulator